MATQQEITKIQEQAQELVSNLDELYKKVGSYQNAKDELQKASSQILVLVESTKQLSEESHQIIKATNQIGSAKILEKLTKIEESHKTGSAKILEKLTKIEESHKTGSAKILEKLTKIEESHKTGSAKILEKLTKIEESLRKTAKVQMIIFAGGFTLLIVLEIILFYFGKN